MGGRSLSSHGHGRKSELEERQHTIKTGEILYMRTIRKAVGVLLVLLVAGCGGQDQTNQAIHDQRGDLNNLADTNREEEAVDADVIWDELDVDEMPVPVYNPPEAISIDDIVEIKHDGEVYLQFVIDVHGIVDTAYVFESSGHGYLDTLALDTIRKQVFTPGIKNGVPVKMRTTQGFIYRVQPEFLMPKPPRESDETEGNSSVDQ